MTLFDHYSALAGAIIGRLRQERGVKTMMVINALDELQVYGKREALADIDDSEVGADDAVEEWALCRIDGFVEHLRTHFGTQIEVGDDPPYRISLREEQAEQPAVSELERRRQLVSDLVEVDEIDRFALATAEPKDLPALAREIGDKKLRNKLTDAQVQLYRSKLAVARRWNRGPSVLSGIGYLLAFIAKSQWVAGTGLFSQPATCAFPLAGAVALLLISFLGSLTAWQGDDDE